MKCKRMHVVFFKIDTCKISVYNFRIYVERLYLKTKWNQNNCSEAFIMFTSYWTVTHQLMHKITKAVKLEFVSYFMLLQ